MRREGQITVFFALCILSICALLLGIVESARTAGARLYFTQAVNSAADSLFSLYHRELWDSYRLLGLEHYSDRQLQDEFSGFLLPYTEVKDWYPLEVIENPVIREKVKLTDREGEIYEREVLEYMKYGLLEEIWDLAFAEDILRDMAEAENLSRISDIYSGHSREAVKLEKSIEKLNDILLGQKEHYERAMEEVRSLNGSGLIRELKKMRKELERIPGQVEDYSKKADALSVKLAEAKKDYDGRKDKLSDEVRRETELSISEYETYVSEDGERRKEIEKFSQSSIEAVDFTEKVIEVAEEVLDYIASYEPEDEDDELDERALWRPVERLLGKYSPLMLDISFGVADKEKEGLLENVGDLLKGNVLELLLPEGTKISKEKLDLAEAPSKTCFSGNDGCRAGLYDRTVLGEYILKEFNCYGRENYGERGAERGSGHLEVEYIYAGKDNDYDNLSKTVSDLLFIRAGLNLIYLYSDTEKRAEAKALAGVVTGVFGFPPLTEVMTFFILGMWSAGQALNDLQSLLAGGKVPVMHSRESFDLSLSGLLDMGRDGRPAADAAADQGKGLDYKSWMRILIFKDQGSLFDYRSMDMIQMNIRKEQPDFLLGRCVYSLELTVSAEAKHVLFSLGILNRGGKQEKGYSIKVDTSYSY